MTDEEQEAINELKSMSKDELDNVDFSLKKWVCQCKGCTNGTTVRDYGISPEFYWPRKGKGWFNINCSYFMCGKHYPFMKKMEKLYGWPKVEEKMIDFSVMPIEKMIDIKHERQTKLG